MQQIGTAAASITLAAGLMVAAPTPASAAPPVTDWAELTAAFAAGGTVVLGADINQVDAQLPVPNGIAVVLDLNGHTLSVVNSLETQAAVGVGETGDLTVSDSVGTGTLTARSTNGAAGGAGIGGGYFGAAGSITITGGTVNASGGFYSAGIGSGGASTFDSVTISGGTVNAQGGPGGAGIGGGTFNPGSNNPHTGPITISAGTVVATGGQVASGIGGGQAQPNGPITISGGDVTANGGSNGSGIGSGFQNGNPDGPTVLGDLITVSGGTVTATGAVLAAGIGGGAVAGGSPLSVTGGTVNASSAGSAPAIGGGRQGSGNTVDISSGATVTVEGTVAFGEVDGPSWGSFSNAGTVNVAAGTPFEVPAGVTAVNTGTINLDGTLTGAGTVTNSGRIIAPVGRVSGNGQGGGAGNLLVTVHNYLLGFDLNGVAGTSPAELPIFTTSVDDAELALPGPTEPPGHTFTGWYSTATGGNRIVDTTDLPTRYGSDGPVDPILYAHWIISQVITYTSTAPSAPVVGDTYAATATGGGSGNPVTFSTSTPAACSVSGSTVAFNHVGDCTIVADQAAGGFYLAAPSVSQTVAVGRAAQTIAFTSTPPADAAVGSSYTVAATGGASGNPVTFTTGTPSVCSVDAATVTFVRADTCTVIAHQAGNADYLAAADQTQNIAIGKAAQAITFTSTPPADAAVDGSYTVAATGGGSGNPVTFSSTVPAVCSVSGATVTFEHAGACTIAADQAGNGDYAPAPTQSQDIGVGKAAQSITFTSTPPADAAVDGSYTVAATGGGSGLPVTFTSGTPGVCSVAGSTVTFQRADTCAVVAHQAGNDDYLAADDTQSIAVGQAAQAITFTSTPPADAAVGGNHTVTATGGGSGLPVTFGTGTPDVCSVAGSVVTFDHVGSCTVVADQAGNADYAPAPSRSQNIGIGKAVQAITFTSTPPADAAVGGSYTVTATGGGSGNPVTFSSGSPAICSVSAAQVTFDHAGDCLIDADQEGDDDHTAASTTTQTVPVGRATQAISFSTTIPDAPVVGDEYPIAATGGGSGNPVTFGSATPAVCTVAGSTITFDHAGDCTIDADQAGNDDYVAASTTSQSATVGKAPQAISFSTTIPAAPVVGDEYRIAATSSVSGGPVVVAATAGGSADPAALAAGGGSGNPITFTSASPSVCTVTASTVTFDHAGDCVIEADQAGNDDYTAAPTQSQATTVGRAPQQITFTTTIPAAPVVGDEYQIAATGGGSGNPVTFTSGTPAVCAVTGSTVTFDHPGDCRVVAEQADNDDYAAATALSQATTIGKAPQRISFGSTPPRAPVAGDRYRLAATGGGSGNPVTFSSSTPENCTIDTSTVTFTRAGDCVVKADQAGNDDYTDAPSVPQTITVAKTPQTITVTPTPPKQVRAGDTFAPKTVGGPSGKPVVVSIDPTGDPGACTVKDGLVTFTGVGVCVVTMTQAGDDEYLPASVRQRITVAAGALVIGPDGHLPDARTGLGFSAALTVDGGLGPYRWAITDGALPPGLTLDPSTGLILGIPSEAGDFTFTVTVVDSEVPAVEASVTYTVTVDPGTDPPPPNPAPAPHPGSTAPPLAATGVDTAPMISLGFLLMLAGCALVGLTRRQRRTPDATG